MLLLQENDHSYLDSPWTSSYQWREREALPFWTLEPFNFDYKLIRTSVLRVFAKNRIKIAQFLKKSKRAASERLREFLTSLKYSFFKIQSRRADPHNKEMRGLRMKHVFLNTIFNFKCLYLYNYSRYISKT